MDCAVEQKVSVKNNVKTQSNMPRVTCLTLDLPRAPIGLHTCESTSPTQWSLLLAFKKSKQTCMYVRMHVCIIMHVYMYTYTVSYTHTLSVTHTHTQICIILHAWGSIVDDESDGSSCMILVSENMGFYPAVIPVPRLNGYSCR